MFISESSVRVRYAETDQMGYVYYGNYPQYYEVGRVEAMRKLGMSYKELEAAGIMLPVLDLQIKYISPAFYDDLLTIKTIIQEVPKLRIKFDYEISNESGKLINKGTTTLVFVDMKTGKPTLAPDSMVEKLQSLIA